MHCNLNWDKKQPVDRDKNVLMKLNCDPVDARNIEYTTPSLHLTVAKLRNSQLATFQTRRLVDDIN